MFNCPELYNIYLGTFDIFVLQSNICPALVMLVLWEHFEMVPVLKIRQISASFDYVCAAIPSVPKLSVGLGVRGEKYPPKRGYESGELLAELDPERGRKDQ